MTRVVTKGEPGRPVERLRDQMEKLQLQLHSSQREPGRPVKRPREQMEKLQLHSSHRSEGKAGMLEQQLTMADQRVRRLDAEKRAAETRAEQAERRVRY